MANAITVLLQLTGNATGAMKALGEVNKGLGGLQKSGATMASLGGKLTKGVTLPIVGLGVAVGKVGMDFESAFTGVIKTTEGVVDATGELTEMGEELRQGFRDLAKEIPVAVEELAGIGEAAGQLGILPENILEFTETIAKLGATTNLVAEEGAMALAKFANITGMAQTDFERLGSAVVALGNNMATTEADIVAMAQRIAGAGATVGMTEADILGLAATLSSVGIEAQMGGSAISRVMIDMANAVANGGDQLRGFADVAGVTVSEFAEQFREAPAEAIALFIDGLRRIQEEGGNVFAVLDDMELSEIRVRDALLRAANAEGLLTDALGLSREAWEENIALTREAELRFDDTKEQVKLLINQLKDIGISVAEFVIPAFRDLLQGVSGVVEWIGELPQPVLETVVKFAALAAAVGPLLFIAGKLITTFSVLIPFITGSLIPALGAILPAVAPIVAVAGALYLAWTNNWFGIRDTVTAVVDALTGAFEMFEGVLEGTGDPIAAVSAALSELGLEGLATGFEAAAEWVGHFFEVVNSEGGVLQVLSDAVCQLWSHITGLGIEVHDTYDAFYTLLGALGVAPDKIMPIVESIGEFSNAAYEFFGPTIERIQEALAGLGEELAPVKEQLVDFAETVREKLAALGEAAKPLVEKISKVIAAVVAVIAKLLGETLASTLNRAGDILGGFLSTVTAIFNMVIGVLTGVFGLVNALIEGNWAAAWEYAKSIFQSVWEGIVGIARGLLQFLDGVFGAIFEAVTNTLNDLFGTSIGSWEQFKADVVATAVALKDQLIEGFNTLKTKILLAITTTFTEAVNRIRSFIGQWRQLGLDLVGGLIGGIMSKIGELAGKAADLVRQAIAAARGAANAQSPSRVMIELGADLVRGLAIGVAANGRIALDAMADLMRQISNLVDKNVIEHAEAYWKTIGAFADSLTGVVNVLIALAEYTSPGFATILQFADDFLALSGEFAKRVSASFNAIKSETIERAQAYWKTIGAFADSLTGVVDILIALADYTSPRFATILQFADDFLALSGEFAKRVSASFNAIKSETIEKAEAYWDAIGAFVGAASDALALLIDMAGYIGPSLREIQEFVRDFAVTVGLVFSVLFSASKAGLAINIERFTTELGDQIRGFSEAVEDIFGALAEVLDFLEGLSESVRGKLTDEILAELEGAIRDAWDTMAVIANELLPELTAETRAQLDRWEAFADTASDIFGPLESAIGFLETLYDSARGELTEGILLDLQRALRMAWSHMETITDDILPELTEEALDQIERMTEFSDAVGEVLGAFEGAIKVLDILAEQGAVGIQDSIEAFFVLLPDLQRLIREVAERMVAIANQILLDWQEGASQIAQKTTEAAQMVGAAFDGVSAAIDAMGGLLDLMYDLAGVAGTEQLEAADFAGLAWGVDQFFHVLTYALMKLRAATLGLNIDLLASIGEDLKAVGEGLKAMAEGMQAVVDLTGETTGAVGALIQSIRDSHAVLVAALADLSAVLAEPPFGAIAQQMLWGQYGAAYMGRLLNGLQQGMEPLLMILKALWLTLTDPGFSTISWYHYGRRFMATLVAGIRAGMGDLIEVLSEIRDMLPASPAKIGPLSKPIDWSYLAQGLPDALEAINTALSTPQFAVNVPNLAVAMAAATGGEVSKHIELHAHYPPNRPHDFRRQKRQIELEERYDLS